MKKRNLIIATLFVVVATAVAFVSCKKESQDALSNNTQSVKPFTAPQIDDMNAYFKDFRQKMQESQNTKDAEYLGREEAAWHLSSLANIDFCRVNVKYDDFQFDTIEMQVNITNGVMLMSDLCMAYEQMCTEIQQFKKGFNHLDQNLYFIKVSIGAEGNAKIALMTSYIVNSKSIYDHLWYFDDVFEALDACYEYYSNDSTYVWNNLGAKELKRVLNLYDHHENIFGLDGSVTMCFVPTRNHTFNYTNTYDPYEMEFDYLNHSRVFAKRYAQLPSPGFIYIFDVWEMCYLLDSYLGLGYDYINDNLYAHEFPVNWKVTPIEFHNNFYHLFYHDLYVEYGRSYIVD